MKKTFLVLLFLISYPPGSLAQELTQEERILKQTILYGIGKHYIENTYTYGDKIARWNKSEFPIKVYIEPNQNTPAYYQTTFIKAVSIWEKELSEILSFKITQNKNEANICIVVAKDKKIYNRKNNGQKNQTQSLAYTQLVINNKTLKKAYIYYNEKTPFDKFYTQTELLNVIVHEMGHAIGISGHSEDKTSVMYPIYNKNQEKNSRFLNKEDKNTIKLLYSITPDITNGNPIYETGTIRGDIVLGNSEERMNANLENAYEEMKIKPGDCGSRLKLAALYEEKNDLSNMFYYIKESEKLAKTVNELYAVHYAYAIYYHKIKNYQAAYLHTEKAHKLKNTPEITQFKKYLEWQK